jgi:hypothetical protein
VLGEDWAVLLGLDENELDLGQCFSALVQLEQHLLALVLLLTTSVQTEVWATH